MESINCFVPQPSFLLTINSCLLTMKVIRFNKQNPCITKNKYQGTWMSLEFHTRKMLWPRVWKFLFKNES